MKDNYGRIHCKGTCERRYHQEAWNVGGHYKKDGYFCDICVEDSIQDLIRQGRMFK